MSKFANAKYQNGKNLKGIVEKNTTIYVPKGANGALVIPCDPKNADYIEIMEAVKAGTITILDAD